MFETHIFTSSYKNILVLTEKHNCRKPTIEFYLGIIIEKKYTKTFWNLKIMGHFKIDKVFKAKNKVDCLKTELSWIKGF